jgi:histidinol-phosphate aminotransferase
MSTVPPYVETLTPYVPGKPIEEVEREYGVSNVAKLASNENALGPSPRALAAAREACARIHLYPDGAAFELRNALAAKLRVRPEEIVVGNGSNELLELVVRTFLGEGEETLTAAQSFVVYRMATHAHGRTCVEVPLRDHRYDLPALAERLSPRTKVVFLANPDNPNGTYFSGAELERFLAAVPRHVLVVLDEAYVEFVDATDFPDGLEVRKRHPNVLVCRTFSKIHGLAGLRLGYMVAPPDVASYLDRVRAPFNVSLVAQAAGVGALADGEHVARSRALVEAERPFVVAGLAALGARPVPSQTNFVLADFPGRPAPQLFDALLRQGVVVRPMHGYGFPTAQRITLGLRAENEKLLAALRKVLAG